MVEIEVGEYVRINNDFRLIALGIGKVVGINQDSIYVKMNFELPFSFKKENIAKHSKQLIDLIEVGDIVNKLEITSFTEKDKEHKEKIAWHNTFYGDDDIAITNNEIKTILTKEQFLANCYKVGGEDESTK